MTRSPWFARVAAPAILVALAASPACRGEDRGGDREAAAPAPAPLPAPAPPGQARTIDIRVDEKGYHPPSSPARAGEKLVLAFTRTAESECVHHVLVDGKSTELPLNQRVEIPVTMPAAGQLVFTCGMKMYEGRVAVAR